MRFSLGALKRLIQEADDYTRKEEIASEYSDAYKDRYGIRPHHLSMDDWNNMSDDEAERMLQDLYDTPFPDDDDYYGEPDMPAEYEDMYGLAPMEGSVGSEEGGDDYDDVQNMPIRIPFKGGTEYDALSRKSKRHHHWSAGERKAAKKTYNRRLRHAK